MSGPDGFIRVAHQQFCTKVNGTLFVWQEAHTGRRDIELECQSIDYSTQAGPDTQESWSWTILLVTGGF